MDRRDSRLRGRVSMRGRRASADELGREAESQEGDTRRRDYRGGVEVDGGGNLDVHRSRTRTRTDIEMAGAVDNRDDTSTLRKKVEQLMTMKNDIMKRKKAKEQRLEELREKIDSRKKDRARYESHLLKIREALKDRDAALISCKEKLKQLEESTAIEKAKKTKLNEQRNLVQRELDSAMEVYRQKVEEFKYLKSRIRKISLDLENFFARSPLSEEGQEAPNE